MKKPSLPSGYFLLPFLLASVLATGSVVAQTTAAATGSDEVVELKPFSVTAGSSSGYRVSTASTATRTNTPLIDIPQSVSIVTSDFWQDTAATNLSESFRYVAGAFVRNRNAFPGTVSLRGFETSDALATDSVRMAPYNRDLAGYERLEVVKGPPSIVQGRGGVGGLFNYILKKPDLGNEFTTVTAAAGVDEYDATFWRATVDANRRLTDDGKLAGRVAAVWQDSDDYIEYSEHKILGAYPSLRWRPTDRLELTAVAEVLRTETPSFELGHGFQIYAADLRRHANLPAILAAQGTADGITPLGLPYNFNAGGRGNVRNEELDALHLTADYRPADSLYYRQVLHVRRHDVDTTNVGSANNVTRVTSVDWTFVDDQWDYLVLQGDLLLQWGLPFAKANTLVGYAFQERDGTSFQQNSNPSDPRFRSLDLGLAVADPGTYFSAPWAINPPVTTRRQTLEGRSFGYFIDQNFKLLGDRLGLFGGIRSDDDRLTIINELAGRARTESKSQLNSYRYGANFKVTPRVSIYAVKSLQNDPTAVFNRFSGIVPGDPGFGELISSPVQNDLQEAGLKGDFLNGRVSASIAYWQLTRTGNSTTFGEDRLVNGVVRRVVETILADAETSGVELEVFGDLTDRLSLIFNYVKMSSEEPDSSTTTIPNDTRRLRFAPSWSSNVFLKYNLRGTDNQGWVLKAGANFVGPVTLQLNNTTGPLAPGGRYYLDKVQHQFDAGVAYRWRNFEVDLQVNNVGSDIVLITRDNPPRTWRLTFTGRF